MLLLYFGSAIFVCVGFVSQRYVRRTLVVRLASFLGSLVKDSNISLGGGKVAGNSNHKTVIQDTLFILAFPASATFHLQKVGS
jgi:hypothetical protein